MEVDETVSDAEIFECKVAPVASSRHIYSQARKKLALLTAHGHDGHQVGANHHLLPPQHNKQSLKAAASRRWSTAGSAIFHGVRATQLVKISASAVRKMNVTKPVGREELLHEKFSHLLAMNDLEERVAVRYGEAKQYTDKFRSIIKTMNHKEQVEAIDVAQCVLDKLEYVRQTVGEIDDESLWEVDESLAKLSALCNAKSLKSRFHRAGRHAMVVGRLQKDLGPVSEKRDKESLRQTFKRAIKRAGMAAFFRSRSGIGSDEATGSSLSKEVIFEDDDELLSPSSRILHQLKASEDSFLTASEKLKAETKKELLTLGLKDPSREPLSDFDISEFGTSSQMPKKNFGTASITASHVLDESGPGLPSMSVRAFSTDGKGGGKDVRAGSMDRAALAAKKQMVRALMLEMHLRELRGQGPLPSLGQDGSDGSSSVPASFMAISPLVHGTSPTNRIKTMPAMMIHEATSEAPSHGEKKVSNPVASLPPGRVRSRAANTPQSPKGEASPFSPAASPHTTIMSPSTPSSALFRMPSMPTSVAHVAPLKGGRPRRQEDGGERGQRSPRPSNKHSNSIVDDMTPQEEELFDVQSPRRPQRVAASEALSSTLESIRSEMGLPSLAYGGNEADNTLPGIGGALDIDPRLHLEDPKAQRSGKIGFGHPSGSAVRKAFGGQTSPRRKKTNGDVNDLSPKTKQTMFGRMQQDLHQKSKQDKQVASFGQKGGQAVSSKVKRAKGQEESSGHRDESVSEAVKVDFKSSSSGQTTSPTGKLGQSLDEHFPRSFSEHNGDWRQEVEQLRPTLDELDALSNAGRIAEAAFAAATLLTTVGIAAPRMLGQKRRIHSFEEMMLAKKKAHRMLEEAESKLEVTDPAEIWAALDQMDCMLSFLEPVCIIENCFQEGHPPVIERAHRAADYDWTAHLQSLRQVKNTLHGSHQWKSLEEHMGDESYRDYISRGEWLHEDLDEYDPLHDYSCSTTSSLLARPDRIEWLNESHQAIIPCRSRHVERRTNRITLEKTVKERRNRGLRLHCVRPEMSDMWEDYCKLVWNENDENGPSGKLGNSSVFTDWSSSTSK